MKKTLNNGISRRKFWTKTPEEADENVEASRSYGQKRSSREDTDKNVESLEKAYPCTFKKQKTTDLSATSHEDTDKNVEF